MADPTDKKWHAMAIDGYLARESGPGKSNVWDWGIDFPDARARWIAVEVDLHAQRLGYKKRLTAEKVELLKFWEEDGEELVRIRYPGAGKLRVKLTTLCGDSSFPDSILLEIQHEKANSSPRFRPTLSAAFHGIGQVIVKGDKVRINRSSQLGACPGKVR
jgi:hypothetical protein